MKNKLVYSILCVALIGAAQGASYVFNNGTSSTASGVVDSQGRAFRNATAAGDTFTGAAGGTSAGPGVVGVGFFTTDDLATMTATSLVAAFKGFGMTTTFASAGATGNRGIFSLAMNNIMVTGTQFDGKNMYVFAGNGTTHENSTEFLVFKSANTWKATDDAIPTPTTYTFRPGDVGGAILFGKSIADVKTSSSDVSTTAGFQMALPVPETSTALLGAFGVLGLLRRRR